MGWREGGRGAETEGHTDKGKERKRHKVRERHIETWKREMDKQSDRETG